MVVMQCLFREGTMTEELDPDEVIIKWEKWIKKLKEEIK